ncbi:MAG: flagellar biosynthesis protein FlhB [Caulobacteraceae bacterium]
MADEDKTEEPTAKRLEEARRKGDVAKSMDFAQAAALAGAFSALALLGGWMAQNLAYSLIPFIEHPEAIPLDGGGAVKVARYAMMAAAPFLAIVMACTAFGGVAGNLIQTGFLFSAEKVKPTLDKLSLLQGFKRLFGMDGMIQFLRSTAKVLLTGAVAYMVLKPHAHELVGLSAMDPTQILPFALGLCRDLGFAVLCLLVVIGVGDWFIQRQRFNQRMRMSKEEVKEEYRQQEGDPHVKGKQKQIRHERARRRMMQAVPDATVVIMNPTHYAVALRYEPGETAAPQCVAKGLDALALKIREVAEGAGVPVIEDPPLARALYASVEIDETIPQEHFQAVAKVIGFIMSAARERRAKQL